MKKNKGYLNLNLLILRGLLLQPTIILKESELKRKKQIYKETKHTLIL